VYHEAAWKIVGSRYHRLASRAAPDFSAFIQESGTGGAVYRPVHASSAKKRRIGGVDDGVDFQLGYIAFERP
jgi:hypothetical protein